MEEQNKTLEKRKQNGDMQSKRYTVQNTYYNDAQ